MKELKELLGKIGEDTSEENVNNVFASMDLDKTGTVNFFEFLSSAPVALIASKTDRAKFTKVIREKKKHYSGEKLLRVQKVSYLSCIMY
jgi:hypothetical protein